MLLASLKNCLVPLWSKFARELKQKCDDHTFDELLVSRNIEEKDCDKQVEIPDSEVRAKALVVENPHKPYIKVNSTESL